MQLCDFPNYDCHSSLQVERGGLGGFWLKIVDRALWWGSCCPAGGEGSEKHLCGGVQHCWRGRYLKGPICAVLSMRMSWRFWLSVVHSSPACRPPRQGVFLSWDLTQRSVRQKYFGHGPGALWSSRNHAK